MIPLLIILFCLFLNAVFSCAEMAFVSVNKKMIHREAESGNKHASLIEKMHHVPERILSVVQIGITLVASLSAAVCGALAKEYITPWMENYFHLTEDAAESISIAAVVIPITFLTVLIGELVPKSIAIKHSFRISLFLAPGLRIAEKFLGFLVTPLERMTKFIVELFFHPRILKKEREEDAQVSIQGLKRDHQDYVKNIVDLDVRRVERAMVKWENVKWISSKISGREVHEILLKTALTRLPVLKDGFVHGFIHLKEFLQVMNAGEEENWINYIRPPIFISTDLKLINALKLMKYHKVQILIVGTAQRPKGILTLEDIIEEVVGDIVDETEDKKIIGYLRHIVIRE